MQRANVAIILDVAGRATIILLVLNQFWVALPHHNADLLLKHMLNIKKTLNFAPSPQSVGEGVAEGFLSEIIPSELIRIIPA